MIKASHYNQARTNTAFVKLIYICKTGFEAIGFEKKLIYNPLHLQLIETLFRMVRTKPIPN